jgi:hypothetical protein
LKNREIGRGVSQADPDGTAEFCPSLAIEPTKGAKAVDKPRSRKPIELKGAPAMRGRKPTPTTLKLMAGNPGKRPLNRHEPKPVTSIPHLPSAFDADRES